MELINLVGRTFGDLTVISRYGIHESRHETTWLCRCSCGKEKIVCGVDLKMGDVKTCGNKRHRRINEVGNVYGNLKVISAGEDYVNIRPDGQIRLYARWICKCSCGNTVLVRGRDLRTGSSKSCGKCMPRGQSAFNAFYKKLVDSANERGYVWELSKEQVMEITSKPCFYCGQHPNQAYKTHSDRDGYIHNGIDRMDNNIGYVLDNVVPCCKVCNYAKRTMSFDSFKVWIQKVYNHFAH